MRCQIARRANQGQALVEAALVTLAFLLLFVGAFDFGQVFFVHQSLVERARAAARWGAVHPYHPEAIRNYVLYGRPLAAEPARPVGFLGLTPANVSVSRFDAGTEADRIVVRIEGYRFYFLTPLIAGQRTGQAVVVVVPYEGS